ncbi:MAG: GxxExxY protein, partial [Calditrichae bacterium]|nr:GxxExxY protein [Calditrichia bacterium]
PDESYLIMGASFNVYKKMGSGFLEQVYQECLEIEFMKKKIPYEAQKELELKYDSIILKQKFKPDFLCFDKIVLEIKAMSNLTVEHQAQVLNYLHATGFKLGLLVNFGHYPKLESKRIVL